MKALTASTRFKGKRLHIGVCGSIAAYKAVDLMRLLQGMGVQVGVTLTAAGARFIPAATFEALGAAPVYTDMFGTEDGTPFGHLNPGACADGFVIAPASAATLSRLAHGAADDMLALQALAFPGPIVVAPAMNPRMWAHEAVQENVRTLQRRGHGVALPACGAAACGDTGTGKLAPVEHIALEALRLISPQDFAGKKVMVTLGPTREPFDAARHWTNGSTGLMGASVAVAAWLRGAETHAVAGPGVPDLPPGVHRHDVTTAKEMFEAAQGVWPGMDYGVFTAAVADFSPEPFGPGKFKKSGSAEGFTLRFTPNPDILASLAGSRKPHQKVAGFAAEADNIEERAREKMARKKADMLVGNLLGAEDSGFAGVNNTVFVCDAHGKEERWPTLSKPDTAWRLLDWLSTL